MASRRYDSTREFRDALFRRRRKDGEWEVVDAPFLEAKVADTHSHVHSLHDPALSLARAGANGVGFLCDIVDVFEDGARPFDSMEGWLMRGAVNMRHVARGGC